MQIEAPGPRNGVQRGIFKWGQALLFAPIAHATILRLLCENSACPYFLCENSACPYFGDRACPYFETGGEGAAMRAMNARTA